MKVINFLTSPLRNIWFYFVDMNSEKGGGVSIKRNMAWGIATLVVFVQFYSLTKMPLLKMEELSLYSNLCKFYVITDIAFILLALGITTLEKMTDLIQRIKGGIIEKVQVTKVEDKKVEQTTDTNIN